MLFSLLFSSPRVLAEQNYAPRELNLSVYADGVVEVEYELAVDPTLARVNITLFGRTYENLIVIDGEGLLLDYKLYNGIASVDVLGSGFVGISYSTSDLTSKAGPVWALSLDAPVVATLRLPEDATIISLSPMPLAINIVGDTATLTMPAGAVEVSYILGIVGTKEHARALLNDAETVIEEIRTEGIRIEDAEALLRQAKDAYDNAQYAQAEQYASQAKTSALETKSTAREAKAAIDDAESAIDAAENAGRTSLLDQARGELQQAHEAYALGDYEEAKGLAEQAASTAQQSRSPAWIRSPHMMLLAIAAVAILMTYLFSRRPAPEGREAKPPEDRFRTDLNSIFERHPHLRLDEKEVLRYVSESGGGVFVSELRRRFDMPKSSAWRMMRRLEEAGIIEVKKVGRESFVQISTKYRLGGGEDG